MKEWCLLHPWMTFLILILFLENNFVIIRGKLKNMENINAKGGIEMKNIGRSNGNGNGGRANGGGPNIRENGNVQIIRPATAPPPPPPPKQN